MIKPREMNEQEKEIIKKIKSQDIASYKLARIIHIFLGMTQTEMN